VLQSSFEDQKADVNPNGTPSVSVIIPTKNRLDDLVRAVESLARQSVLPVELIVVDQSESPEARDRIESKLMQNGSGRDSRISLRYIYDPKIPGGAVARNRAMEVASSDVWLFLDDDVELEPRFVEELLKLYVNRASATGVSGVVTNYPIPPFFARFWAAIFRRGPFHDERQQIYWQANSLRESDPIRVNKFGGGLMSFRASAIRHVRFDENLRGVSDGEDVDFCARLDRGAELWMTPKARLIHKESTAGRRRDHWLRRDARSAYFHYWKNWNRGIKNRLCFLWLNAGYGLVATLGCLRAGSLRPWQAALEGAREGRAVVTAAERTNSR
jgi:GT2 family glycosyltransferase